MKTPLFSDEELAAANLEMEQARSLPLCLELGEACSEGQAEAATRLMSQVYDTLPASQIRGVERYALGRCVLSGALGAALAMIDSSPRFSQEALDAALTVAIMTDHFDFCHPLLLRGANVNARALEKDSAPSLVLATKGQFASALVLLDHGADVTAADRIGFTALHFAALSGNGPLCERLIAAGASIEATTDKGVTPLMMCAMGNDETSALVLIRHGALLEPFNREGKSALAMSVNLWNSGVILALVAAGALGKELRSNEQRHKKMLNMSRLQASIALGDGFLIQRAIEEDADPSTLQARVIEACAQKNAPGAAIARSLMAAQCSRRAIEEILSNNPKPAM